MLRFIVPTVIVEHIKDQEARDAPVALSQSCTIVFQNAITTSELRELDKRVQCWLGTLVKYVDLGHVSEKIFTINQHYLRHLKEIIITMGPPRMYSTFSNERTLGEIKRKVKSPSAPGKKAGNIMVELAAMRFNERHVTTTTTTATANDVRTILTDSTALDSPEIWNPLRVECTYIYARYHLDDLLRNY